MKVDLHIHSKWSDGEFSVKDLVSQIIDAKIKEFAICDHDTIKGSKQLFKDKDLVDLLNKSKIKFHSGVELSGILNNRQIHLLGYDFDINNKEILDLSEKLYNHRREKMTKMLNYLKDEFDIVLSKDSIKKLNEVEGSVGKPHLAGVLIEEGYATSTNEAIKKYLAGFINVSADAPAKEIIDTLHRAGGICVLAHPKETMNKYKLDFKEIQDMIEKLISFGLDGLEVKHSINNKQENKIFNKMAKKFKLKRTFGSDFHGPKVKPNIKLGQITNKIW